MCICVANSVKPSEPPPYGYGTYGPPSAGMPLASAPPPVLQSPPDVSSAQPQVIVVTQQGQVYLLYIYNVPIIHVKLQMMII